MGSQGRGESPASARSEFERAVAELPVIAEAPDGAETPLCPHCDPPQRLYIPYPLGVRACLRCQRAFRVEPPSPSPSPSPPAPQPR